MKQRPIEPGQRLYVQHRCSKEPPHWCTYIRPLKGGGLWVWSTWHNSLGSVAWNSVSEVSDESRYVRLKIEKTPEFQAAYIQKGFGEKDRQKLIETVRRQQYPFEKFYIEGSGVPCVYAGGFALAPMSFIEFTDTGECCEKIGVAILYPQSGCPAEPWRQRLGEPGRPRPEEL